MHDYSIVFPLRVAPMGPPSCKMFILERLTGHLVWNAGCSLISRANNASILEHTSRGREMGSCGSQPYCGGSPPPKDLAAASPRANRAIESGCGSEVGRIFQIAFGACHHPKLGTWESTGALFFLLLPVGFRKVWVLIRGCGFLNAVPSMDGLCPLSRVRGLFLFHYARPPSGAIHCSTGPSTRLDDCGYLCLVP